MAGERGEAGSSRCWLAGAAGWPMAGDAALRVCAAFALPDCIQSTSTSLASDALRSRPRTAQTALPTSWEQARGRLPDLSPWPAESRLGCFWKGGDMGRGVSEGRHVFRPVRLSKRPAAATTEVRPPAARPALPDFSLANHPPSSLTFSYQRQIQVRVWHARMLIARVQLASSGCPGRRHADLPSESSGPTTASAPEISSTLQQPCRPHPSPNTSILVSV